MGSDDAGIIYGPRNNGGSLLIVPPRAQRHPVSQSLSMSKWVVHLKPL